MFIKVITVSALNNYIKKIFDSDIILKNAFIKGEISNFKRHSSGHCYFTLKDEDSKINCVMFKTHADEMSIQPQNGMKVIVNGKVSLYSKDGVYQLYCTSMKPEGLGELYIAFEELKNLLQNEGLFDQDKKRPIPYIPKAVGVITSPTGAAIQDILRVSKRRNKHVELFIYPCLVQGAGASESIVKGIEYFNIQKNVDVIILARGGGSIEELWSFNEEKLARAVRSSSIPIITGVGHETDYTMVDFVSDKRASTPSAAAELAIPSEEVLRANVAHYEEKMKKSIEMFLSSKKNELKHIGTILVSLNPSTKIYQDYVKIDNLYDIMQLKLQSYINQQKLRLMNMETNLRNVNPETILNRGYAIIRDCDNKLIKNTTELMTKNNIKIKMIDGEITTGLVNRIQVSEDEK